MPEQLSAVIAGFPLSGWTVSSALADTCRMHARDARATSLMCPSGSWWTSSASSITRPGTFGRWARRRSKVGSNGGNRRTRVPHIWRLQLALCRHRCCPGAGPGNLCFPVDQWLMVQMAAQWRSLPRAGAAQQQSVSLHATWPSAMSMRMTTWCSRVRVGAKCWVPRRHQCMLFPWGSCGALVC